MDFVFEFSGERKLNIRPFVVTTVTGFISRRLSGCDALKVIVHMFVNILNDRIVNSALISFQCPHIVAAINDLLGNGCRKLIDERGSSNPSKQATTSAKSTRAFFAITRPP